MDSMMKLKYIRKVLFLCFVFAVLMGQSVSAKEETSAEAYDEIEKLTEVMLHIKRQYVEEKTYSQIVDGALNGMMHALDPHSDFLDPEEYRDIRDDTTGVYAGIGVYIGVKNGVLTVVSPIEDTPGYKVGLLSGDLIVEIDGEKTTGMSQADAVERLRGPKDSKVVLTVNRKGETEKLEFEIIRDIIEVPTVKGERIIANKVGYIRITQFSAPTADSFQHSLEQLLENGIDALVLDLRGNPGGLLKSAIKISEKFLEKDQLIVSTKGRPGISKEVQNKAAGKFHYTDFPMVVLVNAWSASAAEIVAGALQDHKRAILIGSTTYGKGSVQGIIELKTNRDYALRLTTQRYFTPSGRQIHGKGIDPDIPVYVPLQEWRDIQMGRAHFENPDRFTEEEKAKYEDVVDRELQRAVDLLLALKMMQAKVEVD